MIAEEELRYQNALLIFSKFCSCCSEKILPLPAKLVLLINPPCSFAMLKKIHASIISLRHK